MAEPSQVNSKVTKLYIPANVEAKKRMIQNYLITHKLDQARMTVYSTYFTSQFVCSILPEVLKRKTLHLDITIPNKDCKILFDILSSFQSPESPNELVSISWEESFEERSGSISTNADSTSNVTYSESVIVVSIWITWCGPIRRALATGGWKEDIECYVYPGSWSIREMALKGIEGVSSFKITDIYGNLLKDYSYAGKADLIETLSVELKTRKKIKGKDGLENGWFNIEKREFRDAKKFFLETVLPALDREGLSLNTENKASQKVKIAQIMVSLVSQKIIDFKERTIEQKWGKLDCIGVYDYATSNVVAFTTELLKGLKENLWSLQLFQQKNSIKPIDESQLRDLTKAKKKV